MLKLLLLKRTTKTPLPRSKLKLEDLFFSIFTVLPGAFSDYKNINQTLKTNPAGFDKDVK